MISTENSKHDDEEMLILNCQGVFTTLTVRDRDTNFCAVIDTLIS